MMTSSGSWTSSRAVDTGPDRRKARKVRRAALDQGGCRVVTSASWARSSWVAPRFCRSWRIASPGVARGSGARPERCPRGGRVLPPVPLVRRMELSSQNSTLAFPLRLRIACANLMSMSSAAERILVGSDAGRIAGAVAQVAGVALTEIEGSLPRALAGDRRQVRLYVDAYRRLADRILGAVGKARPDLIVVDQRTGAQAVIESKAPGGRPTKAPMVPCCSSRAR